jgi:hypothetical protein
MAMPGTRWPCLTVFALICFAAGCTGPAGGRGGEEHLRANLARLGDEDRRLAAAQRWCPVADDSRLGETGVPVKVLVQGQPVFVCCERCAREAVKNPGRTLARVEELRAKAAANPEG